MKKLGNTEAELKKALVIKKPEITPIDNADRYAVDNANSLGKALFLFLFICSSDNDFANGSFIKT